MRISEIFRSLQGEGRFTGTESLFVRTCGCNLRCRYCDTPYASWAPEGEDLSIDEILDRMEQLAGGAGEQGQGWSGAQGSRGSVASRLAMPMGLPSRVNHAVITGGEPMLFAELIPLTEALRGLGWHLTIETSGTLHLPVACDLMSISPKLRNSVPPAEEDARWTWRHEANRHMPEVIRRLVAEYDYQIKFVIDRMEDCQEVEEYMAALPEIDRSRVMLMPQGTEVEELADREQWLKPYCAEHGLRYCPRRHVEWFGSGRGK